MLRAALVLLLLPLAAIAPPVTGAATTAAAASTAPSTPDPLRAIVDEALRANLGLEQERLAERRAGAEVREARARLLPSINLDARYSHIENATNLGDFINPAYGALNQLTGTSAFPTDIDLTLPRRYESHLRLVQPLFNEAARAGLAVASARRDGQRMQLAAAARRLAAEAQIAYLEQASARRVAEIYDATLATVRENERVAERLLDAGRATPEAVQRSRAERAEVEQSLAEARERQLAAARAFNRVLKRPLDATVEAIPDTAFDLPLSPFAGADEAMKRGLAAREELRQVEAGVRTAQAAKRAATSGMVPSVAGVLDYGFQGNDLSVSDEDHVWSASLAFSWSLFDGGGDLARRSAAGYEAERARAQKRDIEDRIALEIRTAYEAATVARQAIVTADVRLEAAARTFTLVRRRFEEGAASPYELVDARTSLTNAQLNRVLTAYRYAIRRVDFERAAALRDIDTGLTKGDRS